MSFLYREFKNRLPVWKGNVQRRDYFDDIVMIMETDNVRQYVSTSTDGSNFGELTFFTQSQWGPNTAVYSSVLQRFVFMGTGVSARLVYSDDAGANWTVSTSLPETTTNNAAYSPTLDIFVSTGINTKPMWSVDGITFTQSSTSMRGNWYSVIWSASQSKFFASDYTSSPYFAESTDGKTWTTKTGVALYQVAYSSALDRLVGVNPTFNSFAYSDNFGTTWTTVTQSTSGIPSNTWREIAYSPKLDLFVACGLGPSSPQFATNQFIVSKTGQTWSAVTASTNSWFSIIWSEEFEKFYATPQANFNAAQTYVYSSDGYNWTTVTMSMGATDSGSSRAIVSARFYK